MSFKELLNMLGKKRNGDNTTYPNQSDQSVDQDKNINGQLNEGNSREDLIVFFKERETTLLNELKNEIRLQIDSVRDEVRGIRSDLQNPPSTPEINRSPDFAGKASNDIGEILSKASIFQKMNGLIENIDYNIRNQNSSAYSKDYVESLQSQINEYREDVFLKLMRKYFVDVYSRVYRHVALLRFQAIKQGMKFESPEIESILREIEISLSMVGIEAYRSKEGVVFDDKEMVLSDKFEPVPTDDNLKKGKVAFSVFPKFIIHFPSNDSDLILSMEIVVLYEE